MVEQGDNERTEDFNRELTRGPSYMMQKTALEDLLQARQADLNGDFEPFKPRNLIVCPNSIEHMDPLAAGYKLHYASPEELKQNGGVCASCRKKFKGHRHNAGAVSGEIELPAEMSHVQNEFNVEQDHTAFDSDGHADQTEDFNFHAVDAALGFFEDAPPDARQQAAEVLQNIWRWLYARGGQTPLRLAAAKLAVLVSGLSPDTLDGATLEAMADELGVSKSAMSKINVNTQKRFSILFPRSRSDESKAHMAAAAMGHEPTFTGNRNEKL